VYYAANGLNNAFVAARIDLRLNGRVTLHSHCRESFVSALDTVADACVDELPFTTTAKTLWGLALREGCYREPGSAEAETGA